MEIAIQHLALGGNGLHEQMLGRRGNVKEHAQSCFLPVCRGEISQISPREEDTKSAAARTRTAPTGILERLVLHKPNEALASTAHFPFLGEHPCPFSVDSPSTPRAARADEIHSSLSSTLGLADPGATSGASRARACVTSRRQRSIDFSSIECRCSTARHVESQALSRSLQNRCNDEVTRLDARRKAWRVRLQQRVVCVYVDI